MKHWFITGTDTEVGKSVITACLAQAARESGSVLAAKPVASGVNPGEFGEDATLIARAAGHEPLVFTTYEAPLSPHRAALVEDQPLNIDGLTNWLDELKADTVLIEGVGGWRVPLSTTPRRFDVNDLAGHVDCPIIVVAANRLGVLNHTLLTVEAIQAAGRQVAAVILNDTRVTSDLSETTNFLDLTELLTVPVLHVGNMDPEDPDQRLKWGRHFWNSLNLS